MTYRPSGTPAVTKVATVEVELASFAGVVESVTAVPAMSDCARAEMESIGALPSASICAVQVASRAVQKGPAGSRTGLCTRTRRQETSTVSGGGWRIAQVRTRGSGT